jgi:hypothetical protein
VIANGAVDVIQSGRERVWVRWNYLCVNKDDDSHPALRGTEDYMAYPNGLVWRRLTYTTLMPGKGTPRASPSSCRSRPLFVPEISMSD